MIRKLNVIPEPNHVVVDDPAQPVHELRDSHNRVIKDLRLGITDRCNFRCVYCLEPDAAFMDASKLLSVDDLARIANIATQLGVEKIRLTGGEPTVRKDLDDIIERVADADPADLAMTTNGSLITPKRAEEWKRRGLKRVTVSLDSLDEQRFTQITRSKHTVADVLAGINAAANAGLHPVRVNAVVVRGSNEHELDRLAELAFQPNVEVRFIEFMPLDDARQWDRSKLVPASEIEDRIATQWSLDPVGREDPSSTATRYRLNGTDATIGIVASVTRPFCGACSRLRITADGHVRPCLFSTQEWDLRTVLRSTDDDQLVKRFLKDTVERKQAGHAINDQHFRQPTRHMCSIGG